MRKNIYVLLTVLLSITIACTKEGEIGPKGDTGANGANGTNSADGTNSEMSTQVFELNSNDWSASGSGGTNYTYLATKIDSNITQAICDSGIVTVFLLNSSPAGWTPLPFNQIITYNSYIFRNWTFFYSPNQITFRMEGNASNQPNPGNRKYKVITATVSQIKANPNVNWKDYEQVKTALGLTE